MNSNNSSIENSNQLIIRKDISELFFIPAIMFIIGFLLFIVTYSNGEINNRGPIIFFLCWLGPCLAGMLYFQGGITIDKSSQSITTWSGRRFHYSSNNYSWFDFNSVEISKEVRYGGQGILDRRHWHVYPIKLIGHKDALLIKEPEIYRISKELAEQIAECMNIEMCDNSKKDEDGSCDDSKKGEDEMIRVTCPYCKITNSVKSSKLKQIMKCVTCRKLIKIKGGF